MDKLPPPAPVAASIGMDLDAFTAKYLTDAEFHALAYVHFRTLISEGQLKRELDEGRQQAKRAEELAKELAEFAVDAACQGSGQRPLTPGWHSFMSTWESADELFRREDFRVLLSPELRAWLDAGDQPEVKERSERG